jgi:hypothetical protein
MNVLISLAKVRKGQKEALKAALEAIENDHTGNQYLRLGDSESTHFVRFHLFDDEEHGPRLLFVANYDGGIQEYMQELADVGPGLDSVFGACEGYDDGLLEYMRRSYCRPRGVYIGFPRTTVKDIRRGAAVRRQIEEFLDLPDVADQLTNPGLAPFLEELAGIRDRTPTSALAEALEAIGRNTLSGLRSIVLQEFLRVAKAYSVAGQADTYPLVRGGFDVGAADRGREQQIQTVSIGAGAIQNQMTTVTQIRPERRLRLQIALSGTTALGKIGWPPGEFANVGTLHWFAWAVLDGGTQLLFLSTFDGSWQNYLQDFINKLVWALDALYNNTYGYPPAGMKDTAAFTDYILEHQYPPEVFYSAYPSETVMNVIRDRQIASSLGLQSRGPRLDQWLGRL